METIKKIKKAAEAPKDIEVTEKSQCTTMKFSAGAYMTVVTDLVKDWKNILGGSINKDLVDDMEVSVIKVHTERDAKNKITQHLVKLLVEGQEVTVTCFDTRMSLMVQASTMLEPYCSRALIPYLRDQIKVNNRNIKEMNAMVQAYDSKKPTTRRQAKEQLYQGESDSFLTPPRLQLQLDLAASQTLLENVIDDDACEELVSLDQYSKSWVFKLSLVFFTATVHLHHIGINLANLLIFACKL